MSILLLYPFHVLKQRCFFSTSIAFYFAYDIPVLDSITFSYLHSVLAKIFINKYACIFQILNIFQSLLFIIKLGFFANDCPWGIRWHRSNLISSNIPNFSFNISYTLASQPSHVSFGLFSIPSIRKLFIKKLSVISNLESMI